MIKIKNVSTLVLLLFTLIISSCGYISDKAPVNVEVYRSDELKGCKIDVNKLGEIFKADQKEQIRCLQENFIQFTKYVRSKTPGSVSETELNVFIRKFFEGQSDSIVKSLSIIFQLNMLLLRDEADRISNSNITPLFELLVHVNQEAVVITQILKDMDLKENQGKFWELRKKFNESVTRFADFTLKIIDKSPGLQKQLNIKQFILDVSKKLGSRDLDPDTVDSLIFFKRILAAGDKEIITSDELKTIISKLPKILGLSFDLYYVKNSNFSSDAEHSRFYLENVRDVYSIVNFNQTDFDLFNVDQMLKLLQDYNKNIEFKKFKSSILSLKSHLLGGGKEAYSLKDLRTTLDIANDLAEKIYFNQVTYDVYRLTLEKTTPITSLAQLELPTQYDLFSYRRISELHADFVNTAVNFRYFRNKDTGVPTYGDDVIRNKDGFLEVNLIKWGTTKLAKGYGHRNTQGELQVNEAEFKTFLFDMRPLLEEFKLWAPNPESFVRNAILLADLFQNKSNGDLEINETEATEYVQMILSSVQITKNFTEEIARNCDGGINKDDPIFETTCYNENFFHSLLDNLNFKKFFPRLDTYVKNVSPAESSEFLVGVEGFARDVADPNIPMNERDSILILGSLINIESTFIRFDTNKDNILDFNELDAAFDVYKQGIITLAKLKPGQEGYAKSIFLYMVTKMEIPPTKTWLESVSFFSFHRCVSWTFCRNTAMKKIEAKRLNVGKLLYYMVNQNTTPAASENKSKKQQQLANE